MSCANDTRFFGLILLGVVVSCFGWDDGPASDDDEEEEDDNDEDRVYVGGELCEIGWCCAIGLESLGGDDSGVEVADEEDADDDIGK